MTIARWTTALTAAAVLAAGATMITAHPPPAQPSPAKEGSREPRDVAPYELDVAAYRLDQIVIVVARGKNRTPGYTTRLETGKPDADPPEVVLRNIPPEPGQALPQVIRPFDVTGYFEPGADSEAITLTVAGKGTQVEVVPIREIAKGKQ